MKKYTKTELKEILAKHEKWLRDEPDGERAYLSGANLSGANLSGAKIDIELLNKFFPLCCPDSGSFIG